MSSLTVLTISNLPLPRSKLFITLFVIIAPWVSPFTRVPSTLLAETVAPGLAAFVAASSKCVPTGLLTSSIV